MCKANSGRSFINFLAACAGSSVNIHFNIFITDFNIHIIIYFRHNFNRSK